MLHIEAFGFDMSSQIATTICTQDLAVNHTPTNHTIMQWNTVPLFIWNTIFHRVVNVFLWTSELSEFLLVGYASFEQTKYEIFGEKKLFYPCTDCFHSTDFLTHFPATYSVLLGFSCDIHNYESDSANRCLSFIDLCPVHFCQCRINAAVHNTFSYTYKKLNIMNSRYTWSKSEKHIPSYWSFEPKKSTFPLNAMCQNTEYDSTIFKLNDTCSSLRQTNLHFPTYKSKKTYTILNIIHRCWRMLKESKLYPISICIPAYFL